MNVTLKELRFLLYRAWHEVHILGGELSFDTFMALVDAGITPEDVVEKLLDGVEVKELYDSYYETLTWGE